MAVGKSRCECFFKSEYMIDIISRIHHNVMSEYLKTITYKTQNNHTVTITQSHNHTATQLHSHKITESQHSTVLYCTPFCHRLI